MRKSESAAKPSSALMGISYQIFPASQQAAVRVGLVSGSDGQRGVVAPALKSSAFVKENLRMFTPPCRAALPIFTDEDSKRRWARKKRRVAS
jgi:hypothetical protein